MSMFRCLFNWLGLGIEGIEILTGIPAGELDSSGNYPPDSINGMAVARLGEMAEKLKQFSESSSEDEE